VDRRDEVLRALERARSRKRTLRRIYFCVAAHDRKFRSDGTISGASRVACQCQEYGFPIRWAQSPSPQRNRRATLPINLSSLRLGVLKSRPFRARDNSNRRRS
jgi:hypothetical protein